MADSDDPPKKRPRPPAKRSRLGFEDSDEAFQPPIPSRFSWAGEPVNRPSPISRGQSGPVNIVTSTDRETITENCAVEEPRALKGTDQDQDESSVISQAHEDGDAKNPPSETEQGTANQNVALPNSAQACFEASEESADAVADRREVLPESLPRTSFNQASGRDITSPGAFAIEGRTVQQRTTGFLSPMPGEQPWSGIESSIDFPEPSVDTSPSAIEARYRALQTEYERLLMQTTGHAEIVVPIAAEVESQDDYQTRYAALQEKYQRLLQQITTAEENAAVRAENWNRQVEGRVGIPRKTWKRFVITICLCLAIIGVVGAGIVVVIARRSNNSAPTITETGPNTTMAPTSTPPSPPEPNTTVPPASTAPKPTAPPTQESAVLQPTSEPTFSPQPPGTVLGKDICSCTPVAFEFTFDFSLACPPVNIPTGGVINQTSCVTQPFGNTTVTTTNDLIPVQVSRIDILELGTVLEILDQESILGPFSSGESFSYTSLLATGDISDVSMLPTGLQLIATGENHAGTTLVNFFLMTYTLACSSDGAELEVGHSFGWTFITDLSPPNAALCPNQTSTLKPMLTEAPTSTPAPPVIGENFCSCSPSIIEFTFDFSLTCPPIETPTGGGIEQIVCAVQPIESTSSDTDLTPEVVNQIEVKELGPAQVILSQETLSGDFFPGDTVSYTSVLGNRTDADSIPTGLQVFSTGRNAAGTVLVNFWIATYTNDCNGQPALAVGNSIGWTVFVGLFETVATRMKSLWWSLLLTLLFLLIVWTVSSNYRSMPCLKIM